MTSDKKQEGTESVVIIPTLGRKVYFVPGSKHTDIIPSSNGCCDATVVDVSEDGRSVNLAINDSLGYQHRKISVPFIQDGEAMEEGVAHAHWMPYQIGQAAKSA